MSKKIIVAIAVFLAVLLITNSVSESSVREYPDLCIDDSDVMLKVNKNGRIDSLDELIAALIHIESSGQNDVIGDTHMSEPSVGCLQIRPIMIREVNNILAEKSISLRYTMKDRTNRNKSISIFGTWAARHHKSDSFEKIARNWNGGPLGYTKTSTEPYWESVQAYAKKRL
jgi:hypothetical protein